MISIIISSVNEVKLKHTVNSISNTIGVPCEFIIKDNAKCGDAICKVYNDCAKNANGEYLCFVHEDVIFNSIGWGQEIITFIDKNYNCGVIGLAGTDYISGFHAYWWKSGNIKENYRSLKSNSDYQIVQKKSYAPSNGYSPVIVVDGFFMFCKKRVWESIQFDDYNFDKFHFYDIDFSFSLHINNYTNYVCHTIDVTHLSIGTCNADHFNAARKFRNKYMQYLPCSIIKISISDKLKYEISSLLSLLLYSIRQSKTHLIFNDIKKHNKFFILLVVIFYPLLLMYRQVRR